MALPFRDDVPTRRFPWVTFALIVVNCVVFLFVQPSAFQTAPNPQASFHEYQRQLEGEEFIMRWGTVPCEVLSGRPVVDRPDRCERTEPIAVPAHKSVYLALLTSMFLHADIAHLAGNMLFLWVFGKGVEDRLGPFWYLGLYVLGGVAAALSFVMVHANGATPLVGASGAIAAAMGAYLLFHPRARVLTMVATAAFQVVYVPASIVLGLFFVTQFFTGDNVVAWEAHVGGMVAGAVLALALRVLPTVKRRRPHPTPSPTF